MTLKHHLKHPHFKRATMLLLIAVFSSSLGIMQYSEYKMAAAQSAPAPAGQQWNLIFNDEFNDNVVDPLKWGKCYYWYSQYYDGCPNSNERQYYRGSQVTESGGSLRLTAAKQDVQGWNGTAEQTYNYTSGMVATVKYNYETYTHVPFATTYGFFEARMKLPAGQGLWPAFWLLEEDQTGPPEIDIMEFLGHDTTTIHMNYHYPENGHQQAQTSFMGPDFSSGWHTYAVNWEPGKITWYIDGVARKTFTGNQVTDKPMYIIMNLAVGGSWPGDPDTSTPFPATMEVDYVRVYKLGTASVSTPAPGNGTTESVSTGNQPATPATGAITTPPATTINAPTEAINKTNEDPGIPNATSNTESARDSSKQPSPTLQQTNGKKKYTIAIVALMLGSISLVGAAIFYMLHHRSVR